ncbi:MAG TPA: glycogen debranching protein GlgX [Actinomycetes bacterium]|nr:glycogen debranching protein GlgX [Actinomycetes bacterium]
MTMLPGRPFPVGVTLTPDGANVAVVSASAESATLCLVADDGTEERLPLAERDFGVFHGFVPGVRAGQRYGLRLQGAYDPARGLRFDPDKLLVDPWARALHGPLAYGPQIYGHAPGGGGPSGLDSAGSVPVSVVVDDAFDWGADAPPATRNADSIVYEVHVKGFTMRHPEVPPELRGTYAGLAHPAVVSHLVDLGVSAVELLPVHHFLTEPSVHDHGLVNYWGYNTLGYFAPHAAYSAAARSGKLGGQVAEFKDMVKTLHAAGLEVILDVVYNHTAEGGPDGPTLSFRGIDNVNYYRLVPGDPASYVDTTGCGNALDTDSVIVLRLIMDSLRYWVEQMHVDGFRFDLAATLGREGGAFARTSSFFDIITQDPVLSTVKLIAEPWDVGQADSYDVGRFPALWSEWNGAYRDTVRDFWRGSAGLLARYATRVTGSSDLYGGSLRRPTASVNFVTAHDGFTLRDLVSYDTKHNEANREDNRDGTNDNLSWNHGVEGPTDDPTVIASRAQAQRTLLAALLTSFGVPMILGGDEIGRTQQGNNNAYCQDNELTWFDWEAADASLLDFTKRLVRLRRDHPVLRRRRFLSGAEAAEIEWFTPSGEPMSSEDWANADARAVAVYLDGQQDPDHDAQGRPLLDDDLLICVNAWWGELSFTIPPQDEGTHWTVEVDTADVSVGERAVPPGSGAVLATGDAVRVAGRSMVVLRGSR